MLSKRKNNFNNLREEYLKDKSDISFYNLPKKLSFVKHALCQIKNLYKLLNILKIYQQI